MLHCRSSWMVKGELQRSQKYLEKLPLSRAGSSPCFLACGISSFRSWKRPGWGALPFSLWNGHFMLEGFQPLVDIIECYGELFLCLLQALGPALGVGKEGVVQLPEPLH